ncbi:hypothetical protein F5890DRAFT_1421394 [Lentinula detonsa]|uniref:SWIM-type domain-containing protein n=1 Tax=Lentinula detonsa TaxID=2804962 RepID=A0AA38UM30_9AGAR|nr:hypothetical protein F5890DRAFT_1421394 [Lentinula detonsa]
MWRLHLHQHPRIPLDDIKGTHRTAEQIHQQATQDVYQYCRKHGLVQVWAYLWNRWYTPKQWILWARASCDAIPRTKTTMMVESTWAQMKRRDLHQFNRPRLDLLTHVVLVNLLPRVRRKMEYIQKKRRKGRPHPLAKWQETLKRDWQEMSKPDEWRLMSKELVCRKKGVSGQLKPHEKEERLTNIEAEKVRPKGSYHTNIDNMTCSCPSFTLSRWLLCKHLVRQVNEKTGNAPLNNLPFFRALRRNHYPPFYIIPGVHMAMPAEAGACPIDFEGPGDIQETRAQERQVSPVTSRFDHGNKSEPEDSEDRGFERSSPFCSEDEGENSERVSSDLISLISLICQN